MVVTQWMQLNSLHPPTGAAHHEGTHTKVRGKGTSDPATAPQELSHLLFAVSAEYYLLLALFRLCVGRHLPGQGPKTMHPRQASMGVAVPAPTSDC